MFALKLIATAIFVQATFAQVSLYVPNVGSGVPMAGKAIGSGNDGRTTWLVSQGTASGTFTSTGTGINTKLGPFTIIEGPSDAHVFLPSGGMFGGQESCKFQDGMAACTGEMVFGQATISTTYTTTVHLIEIQQAAPTRMATVVAAPTVQTPLPTQTSGTVGQLRVAIPANNAAKYTRSTAAASPMQTVFPRNVATNDGMTTANRYAYFLEFLSLFVLSVASAVMML
ncbi:hypothetical protein C8Q75DRAFT_801406 [Abortiporus biennis]|nr:hypothetical protein C8Q75DRAFT_801406 [Abortiporus biennis]